MQKMLSPAGGRREQGKQQRRDRILAAARELIAEGGLAALSTRKLAERADVSLVTLYKLLGSKADVLNALVEDLGVQLHRRLTAMDGEEPLRHLLSFIDSSYALMVDTPASLKAVQLVVLQMTMQDEPHPILKLLYKKALRLLHEPLQRAQRERLIRADIDTRLVAEQLLRIHNTVHSEWLRGLMSLEGYRDTARYNFWLILSGIAMPAATEEMQAQLVAIQQLLKQR